ncbi:MAG: PAS domain-containing protein, partial [Pseudomonadota bacterium]
MAGTTGKRRLFKPSERLVSTTNTGGRILYANREFTDISGYSRDELEGSPHNIVRHPDMPKPVFRNLWDTIRQGKPWMGMVKNRVKNGDHYWVDAYITPVMENGRLQGFQSVRVAPDEACVERAEQCYQRIRDGQRPSRFPSVSWTARLLGTQLTALVLLAGLAVSSLTGPLLWIAALAVVAAGTLSSVWLCNQWKPILEQCRSVHDDDLARL